MDHLNGEAVEEEAMGTCDACWVLYEEDAPMIPLSQLTEVPYTHTDGRSWTYSLCEQHIEVPSYPDGS